MEQPKSIIEAIGQINIGKTFVGSFCATWPFGKIEVYQDSVILKVRRISNFSYGTKFIGTLKELNGMKLLNNDIKGYKGINILSLVCGIIIIHINNKYPPFLQIWISKNKAQKIIEHFNSVGIYQQK